VSESSERPGDEDLDRQPDPRDPLVQPPQSRYQRFLIWAQLRRNILTRLGTAAVILTVIGLIEPSILGWGAAVTAAILAVPSSRFRSYTVAFLPYGMAWLIFTSLRAFANTTGIPLRTEEVTAIERWMFFGTTPTIWLQANLFDATRIAWYDYATTLVHWSYFFVPHITAILVWRSSPALYRRFLLTTMITLGIGCAVYYISPAAPPWLTADRAPQQDIFRVMVNVGRDISPEVFDRTYTALDDPNPVAAMPSLHQAITFVVFLFTLHAGRVWGTIGFLYMLAMAFSLVYTGEHYVIDTIVGSAIAWYAYVFAGKWLDVTVPLFRQVTWRSASERREALPGASTAD
jgi:hypothetical protein